MSTAWVPPRPGYHLRIFAVSLLLVVTALVAFLFLVRLEATVTATGVIESRDQQEVRAALPGVVELGWYEGEISSLSGKIQVRVDARGDGDAAARGEGRRPVRAYKLPDGAAFDPAALRFHRLRAGDELWPGQVLARVRADDLERRSKRLEGEVRDREATGVPADGPRAERDAVMAQLARATVRVPPGHALWLALQVHTEPLAAVRAGDALALLAPVETGSRRLLDPVVRLTLPDRSRAEVEPGQVVRLYPAMYNPRIHGHADAVLEEVEPGGDLGPGGERRFRARARVTHAPFPLEPGSGCKVEVVVGRKQVYRIILEQ